MISEQLLQTKLQIPRRRAPVVVRSRLIDRLNNDLESRLILVSAPAGFGKTTLLTEWISVASHPATWLSLDENDNNLAMFLAYFMAALQKVKASLGETAQQWFDPSPQFPLEPMLINLINDIGSLTDHFIMVIDDYQAIKNKNIHKALSFLIDNLPANMHLVLSTRSDPPLNLAHLRGRGQLTELRAEDLRFTPEEIADFLNRIMTLNLNPEEITLLTNRSEGWIAGLQMAALTLKQKNDVSGFIKAFSNSSRDILDYLFEEVFQQQPAEIRTFLLETSILDRLSPSLCDAVAERQDSAQVLDKIERANLFIFPIDDELRWYRYHPLLKDLLLHTLGNTHPETIPVLHRRASEWYQQENLIPLAISHALKAADYDRAAHLIERQAGEIVMQGQLATYLGWMESFPDSIVRKYPMLILHRILAETLLTGMPLEEVEARLREVEKLDPQGQLEGVVMVVRAVALGNQADTSQNPEFCQKALELLPPESAFWRDVTIIAMGQYRLLTGDVPAIPHAIKLFNEAFETAQKRRSILSMALALCWLAETYLAAGQLHEAQNCFQKIVDVAVDKNGKPLPVATFGLIGMVKLHREWNELDKASSYLEKWIALEGGEMGRWQIDGIIELARTRQARGDLEGVSQTLQRARQLSIKFPDSRSRESIIKVYEIRRALAQGDMREVNSWVKELNTEVLIDSIEVKGKILSHVAEYHTRELELITLIRADIAQNKPTEALKLLDALSTSSQKLGRTGTLLETNILYALTYKALGDTSKALSHFKQALVAAESEGYMRLFIDQGPAISSLLYEAAEHGMTTTYTHRLITALPISETVPHRSDKSIKMEEPLSDRELGVLTLIEKGLSNKEIGERLYIETRTVKWHASNIIGKLGVKNRTQAVAKARELGILKADFDFHSKIN